MRKLLLALMLTTLASSAGCAGMGITNWSCPGTAQLQQRRAERFDPYPQVFSDSETAGVRPRDYDKPALDPAPHNAWPWAQNVVSR